MRVFLPTTLALLISLPTVGPTGGGAPQSMAVVVAHGDDEGPVAPILARYARAGVRIRLVIASDGGAGAGQQGHILRPESGPIGDDLVRQRADEARCAATALGVEAPVLLGFPDGKLGEYAEDRSRIYRITQRIAEELARLRPDVVLTWGPDGGTGHPDHRIVSSIVTQLQRAGAPGVPERLFYMSLPIAGLRAMNPERGAPPMVVPEARYFTVRVPFMPEDLQAAVRSMGCHRSQFTSETIERVTAASAEEWQGAIPLIPAFRTEPGTEVFR